MRTTQYILQNPQGDNNLAVKANGGQVVVEKQVGEDWVVANTFTEDGAWTLTLGRSPTRFTPSGGAAYEVTK